MPDFTADPAAVLRRRQADPAKATRIVNVPQSDGSTTQEYQFDQLDYGGRLLARITSERGVLRPASTDEARLCDSLGLGYAA